MDCAGTHRRAWELEIDGGERLTLEVSQQFQDIEIEISDSDSSGPAAAATLTGDRIRFGAELAAGRYRFDGRVDGDAMEGYVQIERDGFGTVAGWRARRR